MVFTGTYEHSIDAKNRLAIPADIRAQIAAGDGKGKDRDREMHLYVIPGDGASLYLYTEQGFEQRAAELDQSQLDPEQLLEYEQLLFSMAGRTEIDSQGRVRLPENLLKMAGLGNEVVLLGVKDHLEVRDRATWNQYVSQKLAEKMKWFMNPRRAMGKPGR